MSTLVTVLGEYTPVRITRDNEDRTVWIRAGELSIALTLTPQQRRDVADALLFVPDNSAPDNDMGTYSELSGGF